MQKHGFHINTKSMFFQFLPSPRKFPSNYFFIGSENDWFTGLDLFVDVSAHFSSFRLISASLRGFFTDDLL